MINLIPNEEKKKMKKGFYFRLLVLFLVALSISLLVGFVAMLPAYFISSVKNNLASAKLAEQKSEPTPVFDTQATLLIKDVNTKLNIISSAENDPFRVSLNVINAIVLKKTPDIKITQMLYQNNADTGKTVSISGTAPSREALLAFREALQDDASFKNIDLPISNFIKGSNIQFNLSLMP